MTTYRDAFDLDEEDMAKIFSYFAGDLRSKDAGVTALDIEINHEVEETTDYSISVYFHLTTDSEVQDRIADLMDSADD